jgi:hypothetical protein
MSAFPRHDVRVTVAEEMAAAVRPLLPLRIREVEFQDPMVIVTGDHWSLALLGPGSWRRTADIELDWRDDEAEHEVWELCGLDLLDVRPGNTEPMAVSFGL